MEYTPVEQKWHKKQEKHQWRLLNYKRAVLYGTSYGLYKEKLLFTALKIKHNSPVKTRLAKNGFLLYCSVQFNNFKFYRLWGIGIEIDKASESL